MFSGRSSRMLGSCLALGPLLLASAAPVRADGRLYASTWSQEALEGISEALESPELRAMRLAEEELFGAGARELDAPYDPDCAYGVADALSTETPPRRFTGAAGTPVDVSFLSDLKLPNLPIRWDSRVIEYLLFFKNDRRGRDMAAAWLKRVERYGPMIRRVLAEHSLPQDLQFVAMIESGYDPLAHSAQDALGVWQFVKQAGQHYGLRVDHWTDERMDPERSTEAAALFLRDLYDRFGTWELAFAAYNMGYGALLRAVRKYNTNDYWVLSHLEAGLPFETALYVSKITAMAIVANNPERFGFGGLSLEPSIELAKIDVPEGTPLRPIASAAGVDVELLKTLNPHLKKGKVPPGEPRVQVYVPRASYDQFAKRWSKNHEPRQQVGYTVRFGETLEDVARRFSINPARLRDINDLKADAEVRAGFPLLVPAVTEVRTMGSDRPVASVPAKTFSYPDRRQVFYRVAGQDTPGALARFFDVSVDELTAWNNLTEGGVLQKDMLLQLFVRTDLDLGRAVVLTPDQVQVLTVGSDEFFDFHEGQRGRVRVRYRVQPNDTMAKLAEKFELSVGSIGRINQFGSNKELKVDDWVIIYVPEKQIPELEKKGLIARLGNAGKSTTGTAAPASSEEGDPNLLEEDALPPDAEATDEVGAATHPTPETSVPKPEPSARANTPAKPEVSTRPAASVPAKVESSARPSASTPAKPEASARPAASVTSKAEPSTRPGASTAAKPESSARASGSAPTKPTPSAP
ncbi:MAG: transglycosylase SLT domain-containing protein [Myxococcales bacterium]